MLTTALIGYGHWGPNVARNIHNNPNIRLFAICDIKPERLEAAQSVYVNQTTYDTDYQRLLANPDVDAVAVAVETNNHYEVVRHALEAGKHVYVEKPFTMSVAEALELSRIAEKRERTIHVDHLLLFHPAIRMMKTLIDSGDIGDIMYIDAMRMNLGKIKSDANVMWDLAVHDLAIIDFLSDGREPDNIHVVGKRRFSPVESLALITLEYGGFVASVRASWISPFRERRLVVTGTRKTLVFDELRVSEKLLVYDAGVVVLSGSNPSEPDYSVTVRSGEIRIPLIPEQDALYNSIDHFASAVLSGTATVSGPDQAIRVQKILEHADTAILE